MRAAVRSPRRLEGSIHLPGDKAISHRALILGAVAAGEARVRGLSPGADVESTAACLRALGVEIEGEVVRGVGLTGLTASAAPLDCGNSGTTMRFLAGLLAGQPFRSTLVGDESLSRRPMGRVVDPLRLMGAEIESEPLRVGGGNLTAIEYRSPVASAQVKSALLLAGLQADGLTTIREPIQSRNHTELMLAAMRAPIEVRPGTVEIGRARRLEPLDMDVPADFSAAAFWLVAGSLHPRASLVVPALGVNPTRTGLLDSLAEIGLRIERRGARLAGLEPLADLEVGTSSEPLRPLQVDAERAARSIDELPVLAVALTQVPGRSRITGAAELRVKESDRIATMAAGLRALGADVSELPDGLEIVGPTPLEGARVEAAGDHRIAMAMAVAALLASGVTEIDGAECVDISDPGFWAQMDRLGALC